MIGTPAFQDEFERARHAIFRLETLQHYGRDPNFTRFQTGQAWRDTESKRHWVDLVRRRVADGVAMQRVHVVTTPWTDYVRFEITWSYPPNTAAGEDIRIVTDTRPWPGPDFWMFDDERVWLMHYHPNGDLERVENASSSTSTVRTCLALKQRALAAGESLPVVTPARDPRVSLMPARSGRDLLAERLREVRAPRFRSGSALARHLGWQQSKVSRIELGQQLPTRADLNQWAQAVGADPDELHQLLDEAHVQTVSSRTAARSTRGLPAAQDDLAALEQASRLVAEYQPHMIPGLAQTAAYARTWLNQPGRPTTLDTLDIDAVVQARLARQAILYQPHHHIVIALGEAALRNAHGDPEVQRQQLGHLHVIAELPTVELLIEPATAAMAVMRGFEILDDRVILEDTDQARHLTEESIVTRFTAALDGLRDRAVTGAQAAELIRKIERST